MSSGGLEYRYRRLLRWYPAVHRGRHADEMLGVLMAGARPGQRRPGITESANLLWGAARIRLRRLVSRDPGLAWTDSLAVISVIAPLFLLVKGIMQLLGSQTWSAVMLRHHALAPFSVVRVGPVAGPFVVAGSLAVGSLVPWLVEMLPAVVLAILVVMRWRRAAAVAAAVLLILQPVIIVAAAVNFGVTGPVGLGILSALGTASLLVLVLAALLASPGPARGLEIITRRHWLLLAVSAVTAGAAAPRIQWPRTFRVGAQGLLPIALAGVVVLVVLVATSPGTRRTAALLAVPMLYFLAVPVVTVFSGLPTAVTYLPFAGLLCLVAAAVIRRSRPEAPADGHAA